MKASIINLIIAHVTTIVLVLWSRADIVNILLIFVIQNFILFVILAFVAIRDSQSLFKLILFVQLLVSLFMAAVIFAMVALFSETADVIYVNDVPKVPIDVGDISLPIVLLGIALFTIEIWRDRHIITHNKYKTSIMNSISFFYSTFIRLAGMFIVFFSLFFIESGQYVFAIIFISLLKLTVDITSIVLDSIFRKIKEPKEFKIPLSLPK